MTIIITMLWRMKFELEDVEMELEHSGCISRWGITSFGPAHDDEGAS